MTSSACNIEGLRLWLNRSRFKTVCKAKCRHALACQRTAQADMGALTDAGICAQPYERPILSASQAALIGALMPQGLPSENTLAEMRAAGVRGLLICYADYRCAHSITINADQWPDETRMSDQEEQFTCSVCGKKGAEARPDFDWDKEPVRQTGFRGCRCH